MKIMEENKDHVQDVQDIFGVMFFSAKVFIFHFKHRLNRLKRLDSMKCEPEGEKLKCH